MTNQHLLTQLLVLISLSRFKTPDDSDSFPHSGREEARGTRSYSTGDLLQRWRTTRASVPVVTFWCCFHCKLWWKEVHVLHHLTWRAPCEHHATTHHMSRTESTKGNTPGKSYLTLKINWSEDIIWRTIWPTWAGFHLTPLMTSQMEVKQVSVQLLQYANVNSVGLCNVLTLK